MMELRTVNILDIECTFVYLSHLYILVGHGIYTMSHNLLNNGRMSLHQENY